MPDTSKPRCGRCWAPLRRGAVTDEWVNDEAVSKSTCMGSGAHEPMDDLTLRLWNRIHRTSSEEA